MSRTTCSLHHKTEIVLLSTMASAALILLAIPIILKVNHKVEAELNVIPRDTEVMVNDSTYMNCSTSLEAWKVHWRHGHDYVYAGKRILEPYNVRFSVEINSSTGTNNLVIRSVQPSDAGRYECLEDEGFGEKSSAQLIVLDDVPVCKSNMPSSGVIGPNTCGIEPDEIKLSCSITYHGNIFPILQWKASADNQSFIEEGLFNFTSNKNEVTNTLTMNSTLDLSNSSFICQTTRTSNRNYSCSSSDVIKILYVFSNDVINNLTLNDELNCFANTSQSCSYKWKWFNGYDWIDLSNRQILKPNEVGRYRCEATCSIGNKSCTVESMYAQVYSTPASSGHIILALWSLVALVVIFLIGLAIYLRKRNKIRKPRPEMQRLIDVLPQKYTFKPGSVKRIKTKATEEANKKIKGLTILDEELFVVSHLSSEVEVYHSTKFTFSRRWQLRELSEPKDLGSCNINKWLYVLDYKGRHKSSEVLRVDPNGKLLNKWSTKEVRGRSFSITGESNIILTIEWGKHLHEYSPDGKLIRKINLSSVPDIENPWHAVKLINGDFLISHDRHRVCLVDVVGKFKKSFGECNGSAIGKLNRPKYLVVDGDGFLIVVDRFNSRVLLLDSDLNSKGEILSKDKHGLQHPRKILLDQTNGRLLVIDNETGQTNNRGDHKILIFSSSMK